MAEPKSRQAIHVQFECRNDRYSPQKLAQVLNNPSYAGAYVFGRFRSSKSLSSEGQIQSRVLEQPIDSWSVLIQDHHQPYISWQEYLENQQILLHNQTNKPDQLLANIAREGRALLQGLLLCGGCGRRLSPRYKGNGGIYPVYECTAGSQDTIHQEDCIHIQANLVDQAVSQRVLEVLQPEQFQIVLRAVNELQERSEAIDGQWRMRIERLDYQGQLAQRRYEQVDPLCGLDFNVAPRGECRSLHASDLSGRHIS